MEAHSHRKMTLKQNSGAQKKYEFLHLGNWCIKDTLKAFDNFKIMQKSVWSNDFWYAKVYIFNILYSIYSILFRSIQYTMDWSKKQILKKFPSGKLNVTENAFFFFRKLQLIAV